MKLHFKLFITFGLITAAALISIFIYLDRNLNRTYVSQLKENIKKQAQATKTLLLNSRLESQNIDRIVHSVGKDLALRITIIDNRGHVEGDSELKYNDAVKLENHLERPEILDAIKKGEGWSQRFSTTLKKDIIYYAIPFNSSSFNGFIRFAIPVERVSLVFDNTEGALLISILIVFIATLFVAIIAFNFISRPISNLANQAKRIADGDYSKKLIVTSRDEVGELSNSLNSMSESINERIKEILNNNSKFEAVLLSMFEGVMVLDSTGRIQLMNTALKDMLKIDDNPVGKRPIEIIRNVTVQEISEGALLIKEGVITKEEYFTFPYSKTILMHASPVCVQNNTKGAVIVFSDLTELKRLETIRKDFVANVSHELRTPISSIKGYAETLLDGAIEDKNNAKDFIKIIHDESDRLASLINDILDLSKIESDAFNLKLNKNNLYELADGAINKLRKDSKGKSIEIKNNIEKELNILSDHNLITQVFLNLISNAIKYSHNNSIINISSIKNENTVKIEIEDSGIGIPQKDLQRIFERFYRVDKARSKDLGGTGLGLSIVKHIIHAHGGEIYVRSVEGQGSTFGFNLPTK